MSLHRPKRPLNSSIRYAFSYIALWQWAGLLLLLLLIWVNEIWDLPAFYFGIEPRDFSVVRGCLASAAVLLIGIVTVGHTYAQQRRLASGLVAICSYCHKIRIDPEVWEQLESYIGEHTEILFTHGICPDCYKKLQIPGMTGNEATARKD